MSSSSKNGPSELGTTTEFQIWAAGILGMVSKLNDIGGPPDWDLFFDAEYSEADIFTKSVDLVRDTANGKRPDEHAVEKIREMMEKPNMQKLWRSYLCYLFYQKSESMEIIDFLNSKDLGPAGVNALLGRVENYIFEDCFSDDDEGMTYTTALHWSISDYEYHWKVFEHLLRQPNIDVNIASGISRETTPLLSAVAGLQVRATEKLLQRQDLDINKKDTRGKSCLSVCPAQNFGIFDMLLADRRFDPELLHDHLFEVLDAGIDPNRAVKLIEHPQIDLNAANSDGRSAVFYICELRDLHGLCMGWHSFFSKLFHDERMTLQLRDNNGGTVEQIKEIAAHSPVFTNNLMLFQQAERQRLRWAKQKVRILEKWEVPPYKHGIDEAVLSTYILPYVADIISPVTVEHLQ